MSAIGDLFNEYVIDNINDFFENADRRADRRRHEKKGLSDEEEAWAAESWVEKFGQAYCDAVYAAAKELNDREDLDNSLDVLISDQYESYNSGFLVRSQATEGRWDERHASKGLSARSYCYDVFDGEWGYEATPLCAMLMTAVLARTFEDYGFTVSVFSVERTGKGENWCFNLSWEYGVADEEAEDALA